MMARARLLKPGFFMNEDLAELSMEARLLFAGLWTLADREGRLHDRPRRIKAELFPYDNVDCDKLLAGLEEKDFIIRYEADGIRYLQVKNFILHQQPHYKEPASVIPAPEGHTDSPYVAFGVSREQRERILARDNHRCLECGATENLTIDHRMPRSRGGSGEDENLQVLCRSCNSRKNNRLASIEDDSTSAQVRSNVEPTLAKKTAPLATEALYGDGIQKPYTKAEPERETPPTPSPGEAADKPPRARSSRSPKLPADGFDAFYAPYPRHDARQDAVSAWNGLTVAERARAREALPAWKACEQWEQPRYVPQAATFLNQRRFDDTPPPRSPARASPNGNGTSRATAIYRPDKTTITGHLAMSDEEMNRRHAEAERRAAERMAANG